MVENVHKLAVDTEVKAAQWGTGGMATKLTAARLATSAGTKVVSISEDNKLSRNFFVIVTVTEMNALWCFLAHIAFL